MGGGGDNEIKETAYEKELASIARQELAQYKSDVIPFRNKWIEDVTRKTGDMEQGVAGQVNANVAQKAARATALPVGIDPSSGMGRSIAPSLAVGNVGAKAALSTNQSVRQARAGGLQSAINVMRGENVDAQHGLQSVAHDSVKEAISDAENDFATRQATASAIGSLIGTGAGMYANATAPKEWDSALQASVKTRPYH